MNKEAHSRDGKAALGAAAYNIDGEANRARQLMAEIARLTGQGSL